MKRLIAALFLASLSLLAGPLAGKRVASFTLPDATGKYYDVLDFRGKVLLIDIMKTECPHCQALSKTLERIKAKYGNRISVLSVVNPPDNPQTVAAYIARYKVTNPILFDFGQATAAMLRITPQNPSISLPTLLVVDANGIVRDDLVYSDALKTVFDGDGLVAIIDRALVPAKK
jgi:thiol-disulfide isomerase/thioredoxin